VLYGNRLDQDETPSIHVCIIEHVFVFVQSVSCNTFEATTRDREVELDREPH